MIIGPAGEVLGFFYFQSVNTVLHLNKKIDPYIKFNGDNGLIYELDVS